MIRPLWKWRPFFVYIIGKSIAILIIPWWNRVRFIKENVERRYYRKTTQRILFSRTTVRRTGTAFTGDSIISIAHTGDERVTQQSPARLFLIARFIKSNFGRPTVNLSRPRCSADRLVYVFLEGECATGARHTSLLIADNSFAAAIFRVRKYGAIAKDVCARQSTWRGHGTHNNRSSTRARLNRSRLLAIHVFRYGRPEKWLRRNDCTP